MDRGVSKHIQLPASDNKMITLAKTEEVKKWSTSELERKNEVFVFITREGNYLTILVFSSLTQAKLPILRRTITSALTVSSVLPLHNRR